MEKQTKAKKLLTLLQLFKMHNVVKKATRITPKTKFLIDLIVTRKPELVRKTGVLPCGISDHSMIYATLRLVNKRPPPKVTKIRNFKYSTPKNSKPIFNVRLFTFPLHSTITTIHSRYGTVIQKKL